MWVNIIIDSINGIVAPVGKSFHFYTCEAKSQEVVFKPVCNAARFITLHSFHVLHTERFL